ncbi:MAG: hypothetical protein ACJ763_00505 [Bdellovibrionia bacterium]
MKTPFHVVFQVTAWIALTVVFQAAGISNRAWATPSGSTVNTQSIKASTLQELEHGISDRLKRVEEFRFIEQEAAKLGVRAWLFGGTASAYAHYVKWDMQRESGDSRIQKGRFDYDYTSIYRSTQDLDVVIDGSPEQAEQLQRMLELKYPHRQGDKSAWEVRLLAQNKGEKFAILNNPDFMNQHTDSSSVGMIEITKSKAGEGVVRDVREWNAKEPAFLKDVHDGVVHYYFSPLHSTTQFAKDGRNPPILSVIRYLTKAFQYDLQIPPQDLAQIKKVVEEFNPAKDLQTQYASHAVEYNGRKLFQHATNIELVSDTLEKLGLKKKLQAIPGNVYQPESLAWWLTKEPLRAKPVGKGTGKTARELGLDTLAHETNSIQAYEIITSSLMGDANVLSSRDSAVDEAAKYGEGFYTKVGEQGDRNGGLNIKFRLDPNAREGEDFTRVLEKNYVIIHNKAAIHVIPESVNGDPVEYFQSLARHQRKLDNGTRSMLDKVKRKIAAKSKTWSKDQVDKILNTIKESVDRAPSVSIEVGDMWSKKTGMIPVLSEWFDMPISLDHPEIVKAILDKSPGDHDVQAVITSVLNRPEWKVHPELIEYILKNKAGNSQYYVQALALSKAHWKEHPSLLKLTGGEKPTAEKLAQAFARGETLSSTLGAGPCMIGHLQQMDVKP